MKAPHTVLILLKNTVLATELVQNLPQVWLFSTSRKPGKVAVMHHAGVGHYLMRDKE